VRQTAPLFDKIHVVADETRAKVEAHTEDSMVFLVAELAPAADLGGDFGISNLALLKKLLDTPTYKSDNAKLQARRLTRGDHDYVAELEFRDGNGGRFLFRTIHPRILKKWPQLGTVNWDCAVEMSKAKLHEVTQLAGMLAQFDQHFSVGFENHTLLLHIGANDNNSHNATVPLATDLDEVALPNCLFLANYLITILKNAGEWPLTIRFGAQEGVVGITIKTDQGSYDYLLRGSDA
jgi:hypothetical protein